MLAVLTICALAALSCTDEDLTAPHAARQEVGVNTLVVADTLCTKMQFTITSATAVTTSFPNRTTCSTTGLVLIRGQVATWAQSPNRRLTLFVRVLNKSGQMLQMPVRLYLPPTGTTVIAPAGTPASKVVPLTPDSVDAGGGKIWFIGGTGTLAANDSTVQDTIKVNVMSPVTQARFQFQATANTVTTGGPVPALPPDSFPATIALALFQSSNMLKNPNGTDWVPQNLIQLAFKPTATQPERQAAVDAVSGTVVGGIRIDVGAFYFVQIPGDGTFAGLWAAIKTLEVLPQVDAAIIAGKSDPNYRRPLDGAGWSSWALQPGQAQGANWALEAINAPAAWGCDTGSSATIVGVIDQSFGHRADVDPNVDPASNVIWDYDPLSQHGTAVAAVLGARGNNSLGMTGVNWTARLLLDDVFNLIPGTLSSGLPDGVAWAVSHGARVINISRGVDWGSVSPGYRPTGTPADTSRVMNLYVPLIRVVDSLSNSLRHPLLVISAGNDTSDAWWNGTSTIAAKYPGWVINVGGIRLQSAGVFAPYRWSNYGTLVDVVAPAEGVYSLGIGLNPAPTPFDGTSLSAPLVAGVASLLASFDSSLTAEQIKQFIVQGALAGNRIIGGKPLVNAYESLKLAAARPKAPLCGNRMWTSGGGALTIQRGTTTETLSSGGTTIQSLDANHGGKRIDFIGSGGPFGLGAYGAFFFADTNWLVSTQPGTLPPGTPGGFLNPTSLNHARDSAMVLVYANQVFDGQGRLTDWNWQFKLRPINVSTGGRLLGSFPMHQDFSGLTSICIQRDSAPPQACQLTDWIGTADGRVTGEAYAALSPHEDKLIVAFNVSHGVTTTTSGWVPCPWIHSECINLRRQTDATAFEVWRVDIPATGIPSAPLLIHTEPLRALWGQTVQINEESQEFRVSGFMSSVTETGPDPSYFLSWRWLGSGGLTNCRTEFRPVATGSPANLIVNGATNCTTMTEGTFAPIRRASR